MTELVVVVTTGFGFSARRVTGPLEFHCEAYTILGTSVPALRQAERDSQTVVMAQSCPPPDPTAL